MQMVSNYAGLRQSGVVLKSHLILRKVVLLSQDLFQRPEAHLLDVAQLTMSVEVVFGILAGTTDAFWYSTQQLYEQCQVILIPVHKEYSTARLSSQVQTAAQNDVRPYNK